jgi:hypothetical protein
MQWLSPFFLMEAKFGTLEKKDKKPVDISGEEFFRRTAGNTLFDHKSNEEIL